MKKILLSHIVLLSFSLNAQTKIDEQKIKLYVKAGLNITGDIDNSYKPNFFGGFYTNFNLSDKLSIQPELLFSMQGGGKNKYSYVQSFQNSNLYFTVKEKYKLNYINIPVMVQYEFLPGLKGQFGPQFGFAITKNKKSEKTISMNDEVINHITESNKSDIKTFDFGLNLGAQYELKNGLNFSVRYNFGLTDISKQKDITIRNSVFSFGIGYMLEKHPAKNKTNTDEDNSFGEEQDNLEINNN